VRALVPTPQGPLPIEVGRTAPVLPFSGGLAEQPACVLAAFRIMDAAAARLAAGFGDEGGGEDEETE
jgi:hypothetical protein